MENHLFGGQSRVMIRFFKGLLSSDKIIDSGLSALDKVILTDEEKLDLKLKFIESTMPMRVARRWISLIVTIMWSICTTVGAGLVLVDAAVAANYLQFYTHVTVPFSVIVSFYFFNERYKGSNPDELMDRLKSSE